ncbi:MAG: SRPBCC family protein [Actinomycetota bacterium]
MINERAERVIERPVAEVFEFMAELSKVPDWVAGVREAHPVSGDPRTVGAKIAHVNEFMGRTFESTFEVTAWEHERLMVFEVLSGPLRGHSKETLEPLGEASTRVEIEVVGDASGPFKLLGGMAGKAARHQLEASLDTLKSLLEQSRNDSRTPTE